jgi:protein SCO1
VKGTLLVAAAVLLASCIGAGSKLPKYDHVPQFQMTDSEGQPFDSRQLGDKIWIADFIYTLCPGPCPMMTSKMHRLTERLRDAPDVRFVSFSVDPANDTPAVLNGFAHHFGGPSKQWTFVTGTPDAVHTIAFMTFHLGDLISKMPHSTKFALVDKSGDVRGYYSSDGEEEMNKLVKDAQALR